MTPEIESELRGLIDRFGPIECNVLPALEAAFTIGQRAERERCAQIAESFACSFDSVKNHDAAREIAAAFRDGSESMTDAEKLAPNAPDEPTQEGPHTVSARQDASKRQRKCKYEKALRSLVNDSQQFMRWLDAEMVKPSTADRGKRVAQAVNALNMRVDSIRYSTLGVDFRKDRNPTFGTKRPLPSPPQEDR